MKSEGTNLDSVAKLSLAGFAIVAFFIYLPAFVTTFGIHNDYCFLGYRPFEGLYPETTNLMALGRPLGAVLLNVHGLFLGSLDAFAYARFVSFTVLLGCAYLVFRHLVDRLKMDAVLAASIAFSLLLIPGCQVFILWVTNFVPGALNVLFSLLCYRVLDRTDPIELMRGQKRACGSTAWAMGFFLLTLCIYPPTALTFLALTFANILFSPTEDWPRVRRSVIRDLTFAGTGMFLYFLAFKFVLLPLFKAYGSDAYQQTLVSINQVGTYRFVLATNLTEKLQEFAGISVIAFGGALHAIIGDPSAWIIGGLVVTGVSLVSLYAVRHRGNLGNRTWVAQKCLLGILITLCASAPSLAAQKGEVGYRVLTTYEFIALLCLFAPLHWLLRMTSQFPVRELAVALALVTGALGGWNVSDAVRSASRELMFISGKLQAADKDKLTTIVGIMGEKGSCYVERPLLLEFAYPIGYVTHFAGAIQGLLPRVGLENRQLMYFRQEGREKVTLPPPKSTGGEARPLLIVSGGAGMLSVDEQSVLINLNEENRMMPYQDPKIPVIRTSTGTGGRALFDGASPACWEAGPGTQWVELTLPNKDALHRVVFCAGPDPESAQLMPKDCNILTSEDEVNWLTIGSIRGQTNWKAGEARIFPFPRQETAKHYLFVFTSGNGPTLKLYKIGF